MVRLSLFLTYNFNYKNFIFLFLLSNIYFKFFIHKKFETLGIPTLSLAKRIVTKFVVLVLWDWSRRECRPQCHTETYSLKIRICHPQTCHWYLLEDKQMAVDNLWLTIDYVCVHYARSGRNVWSQVWIHRRFITWS